MAGITGCKAYHGECLNDSSALTREDGIKAMAELDAKVAQQTEFSWAKLWDDLKAGFSYANSVSTTPTTATKDVSEAGFGAFK